MRHHETTKAFGPHEGHEEQMVIVPFVDVA